MAKNSVFSNAMRSLAANAIDQEFDNGYLRIYSLTQPASPDEAIGAQVLLAELRMANPAVSSETNGVLTFDTLTPEDSALATGVATWARCLKSDGTTAILDISVGTSDANVILGTTSISVGVEVHVSAMTVTVAQASSQ